jgi:hypothetical protein
VIAGQFQRGLILSLLRQFTLSFHVGNFSEDKLEERTEGGQEDAL